jgi:hypothetical protein
MAKNIGKQGKKRAPRATPAELPITEPSAISEPAGNALPVRRGGPGSQGGRGQGGRGKGRGSANVRSINIL